jgi:hypothetical protein
MSSPSLPGDAQARARLKAYLDEKGLRLPVRTRILPTARTGPFVQSFAQQRIWFIEQAMPGTSMYNMPECARIRGHLNFDALCESVCAIVARHEAWRTTFATRGGEAVQIVHNHQPPDIRLENTSEDEAAARERLIELCGIPFDLVNGPLVRVHVLVLAPDDHIMLINVHHLISDGWSTGIFVREFIAIYGALIEGRTPVLDPPALQYGDYVLWQRQTLSNPVFDAMVKRWAEMVGPYQGYAVLPTDRARVVGLDDSGEFSMLNLSRERTKALNILAQKFGVTLFVVLSMAFKLALIRMTGNSSVSLGVPVAGRNRREFEGVIGLFANTVVLHTDLSGDPTLADAIERERKAWIITQTYQDVPFERLVEQINPRRSSVHHPFFQIMFILQNTPMPPVLLPNASIEFIATGTHSVKFDLVFELYETDEGLQGWLGYLRSLFDERTISRLISLFKFVLEDLPGGGHRRLSTIGIQSPTKGVQDFLEPL